MTDQQQLCDSTNHCIGRQFCELGTWVQPQRDIALLQARQALLNLGEWLPTGPHSAHEILAAIFESIQFADDPSKIDLLWCFFDALPDLGYKPGKGQGFDRIWSINESDLQIEAPRNWHIWNTEPHGIPVKLKGVNSASKPPQFGRIMELMVFVNYPWLRYGYNKTSDVIKMLFPGASKIAIASWLTQEMDDTLFRVGYSPVSSNEDDKAGVFDDPEWFCDGDPKDALQHNLWHGEPEGQPGSEQIGA